MHTQRCILVGLLQDMPDATQVELLYSGTEVEDGTVPVQDMVDALVGFSGAYSVIARYH
jgi:hypothetical protein